ncbi:hypothetical protein EYR36_011984 [Pleurotus pulmonarius]|nr:hypothetical protein EYR36_011984 [Pleurotus pulmonarius]
MPYLRTLDVRHFELPQTISVLPQLRRLCYLPPMGTSRTTVAAMLSFLRSTPSLEHLDILSALRPLDNGGKETATVELTKLSSLSYTTPEFGDLSLFRFLHYPPSLRVKFSSSFPPPDTAACTDDLASILTRVGESDAAATAEVISLTAMEHDYFDVQVSSHDGPMIDIRFPVLEILPLLKLPTKLPCSGSRTLRIRGFHSVTVSDWASFFTRHPQVRDLTAVEVDASFFRALLRPSENEPPPFMGIQRLVLSSCDIEEDTTLFKRVLEEHRHLEADVGVTLEIEGCRVAADTIRELEAYAKVVWDGIKKLGVDSEEDSEDSDDDGDSDDSDEDSDYN